MRRTLEDALSARFHHDLTPDQIKHLAEANSRLVLDVGKKAPLELINGLTAVATEAVESDEEFTLKTANGSTYSRNQLLLTRTYTQRARAFLDFRAAWNESALLLDGVQ